MARHYAEDLERRLKDPTFKKAYDELETEFTIIQTLIDARKEKHLTQKELSIRTGVHQADISRIEKGVANPTLKLLQKLAKGMDMELRITFTAKTSK